MLLSQELALLNITLLKSLLLDGPFLHGFWLAGGCAAGQQEPVLEIC